MNGSIDRKLVAELIIVVTACAAAWMLFVQPKIAELAELETAIAAARDNPIRNSGATIEQMASRIDDVRGDVRTIAARNEFGRDSSRMYGVIMSLAKDHGVTVQRLDPGSKRRADGDDSAVQVVSFNMNVEGRYREVAAFLESILDIDGYVRPGSLNLTPIGQEGAALVAAQFACEALSFAVPEALTALVENDDAQP